MFCKRDISDLRVGQTYRHVPHEKESISTGSKHSYGQGPVSCPISFQHIQRLLARVPFDWPTVNIERTQVLLARRKRSE